MKSTTSITTTASPSSSATVVARRSQHAPSSLHQLLSPTVTTTTTTTVLVPVPVVKYTNGSHRQQQQHPYTTNATSSAMSTITTKRSRRLLGANNGRCCKILFNPLVMALIMLSLFFIYLPPQAQNVSFDVYNITSIIISSTSSEAIESSRSSITTSREDKEVVPLYEPPGWSDVKLVVYMTTHFPEHHELFLPCWKDAVQRLPIFKYADLILFTASENATEYVKLYLPFQKTIIKKYNNTGYQEGAVQAMIDPFLDEVSWFDGYDWVLRLNADVLIKADTWFMETMLNSSIDAIFHDCYNRKGFPTGPNLHSDFNAYRPHALDRDMILSATRSSAEGHFTDAVQNIYNSQRFAWVEGAENPPGLCRIEGKDSPVVHVHQMYKDCPYYYNSTLKNEYGQ